MPGKIQQFIPLRPQNPLIWKNVEIIILPFTDTPWLEKCENYVFLSQKPLDVTNHSVAREVVTFFTLPPGEYIVMPQTNVIFFPHFFISSSYWLRVLQYVDVARYQIVTASSYLEFWLMNKATYGELDKIMRSNLDCFASLIKEIMDRLTMIYFES